ncbi:unnamed protein product [Brassicogethes aeneus]|uniref:Uncharacterized protein n=1 Tax=Brassicogethes aeneus TaxID=1431903 RepID=A0A9P0AVJ1_BRAAE|nr:unnamed protein product [Brassicogethes aeneus]
MFFQSICCAILVTCVFGRQLQISNSFMTGITVSVTGYSDIQMSSLSNHNLNVEEPWSGIITACHSYCGDDVRTQAQLTLSSKGDSYAVSLVNGFNIRIRIETQKPCNGTLCYSDLLSLCPQENRIIKSNRVVACMNTPSLFEKECPEAIVTDGEKSSKTKSCHNPGQLYRVNFGKDFE